MMKKVERITVTFPFEDDDIAIITVFESSPVFDINGNELKNRIMNSRTINPYDNIENENNRVKLTAQNFISEDIKGKWLNRVLSLKQQENEK